MRPFVFGMLFALAVHPVPAGSTPATDRAIGDAVAAAVGSRQYQMVLPTLARPQQQPSREASKVRSPSKQPEPWKGVLPDSYPPLVRLVFWLLVFSALAYVLLPVVLRLQFRPRRRGDKRSSVPSGSSAALERAAANPLAPSEALARARALAGAGKCREAALLLMLAALHMLSPELRDLPAQALTNRELAKGVAKFAWASLFHEMVATAEVIRFSRKSVGQAEVEFCCVRFERLEEAVMEARRATGSQR